jgi:hypothetical protein
MTALTHLPPRPLDGGPDDPRGLRRARPDRLRRRLVLPGVAAVVLQAMVVADDGRPAADTLVYLEQHTEPRTAS